MELHQLFERVNQLTKMYGNLEEKEIKELRILSSRVSNVCADILYDIEIEKTIGGMKND